MWTNSCLGWGPCPNFQGGHSLALHLPDLSRHWYVHVLTNTPPFPQKVKNLKTSKSKLERHANNIKYGFDHSKWLGQAVICCDESWEMVLADIHLLIVLTSKETYQYKWTLCLNIYLFVTPLLNCLWYPPHWHVVWLINNTENTSY